MSFYHVHKGDLVNLLKPGLLFSRNQSGNHYLDGYNDEIMAFAKSCLLSCHYLPVFSDKYLSLVVRKPDFCICENKDADQLRSNREVDQRLCFRYTASTIPLLSMYEISSL